MTQDNANHDAVPAAITVSDEDRTDKAATSHRRDRSGNTPVAESATPDGYAYTGWPYSSHETGFTFVEVLTVVAIIATLVGLLLPAVLPHSPSNPPPETIHLWTVQHDGHWWIKSVEHFAHHPDCPCTKRTAEAAK